MAQVKPLKLLANGELSFIDSVNDELTMKSVTAENVVITSTVVGEKLALKAVAGDDKILNVRDENDVSVASIDKDGNLIVQDLTVKGVETVIGSMIAQSELSVEGNFSVSGNVTLGNSGTDLINFVGMSGTDLNMNGKKVTGLAAPTLDSDASTKKYADDGLALKLDLAGGTLTGPLSLSGAPTLDLHAASKKFVDDSISTAIGAVDFSDYLQHDGSVAMSANLDLGSKKIINLANGSAVGDAVNFGQLSTLETALDGRLDTLEGYNLNSRVSAIESDYATSGYVTDSITDALANASFSDYINKDGSVAMAASLNLNSNKIVGLANGSAVGDAVNKGQLDTLEQTIKDIPESQRIFVSKTGSDTNVGSRLSPFLTIEAAQTSILDASPAKNYIIEISPGSYQESATYNPALHIYLMGNSYRDNVKIAKASGNFEVTFGLSDPNYSSVKFINVSLYSPTVISVANGNAVASNIVEFHNAYIRSTVSSSNPNLNLGAYPNLQVKYTNSDIYGAHSSTGFVANTVNFSKIGNFTHGDPSATDVQGLLIVTNSFQFGGNNNLKAYGADVFITTSTFDFVTIETKGLDWGDSQYPMEVVVDAVSMPHKDRVYLDASAEANFISKTHSHHVRYDAPVSGDWTVVPKNVDDAISELAARSSSLGATYETIANVNSGLAAKLNLAGGTMLGALVLSGAPTIDLHAATKKYSDDSITALNISQYATTGYVDGSLANKLDLAGGTMLGAVDMGGFKITSLLSPTASGDAANKAYVDSAISTVDLSAYETTAHASSTYLTIANAGTTYETISNVTSGLAAKLGLAGGTMTGAIAMGGYAITGLLNPVNAQDAVTKSFLESALLAASSSEDVALSFTASGAIAEGSPVFVVASADDTVAPGDASSVGTSRLIGIAEEAILDTASGKITISGFAEIPVGQIDGGSFSVGAPVYLSENAGKLTSTAPSTPGSRVYQVGVATASAKLVIDLKQGITVT